MINEIQFCCQLTEIGEWEDYEELIYEERHARDHREWRKQNPKKSELDYTENSNIDRPITAHDLALAISRDLINGNYFGTTAPEQTRYEKPLRMLGFQNIGHFPGIDGRKIKLWLVKKGEIKDLQGDFYRQRKPPVQNVRVVGRPRRERGPLETLS